MSFDVDGLKANTDIVAVVGSYVALKKRGKEYVGLCVAHGDKNPSMYVSPDKRIVHCFACEFSEDVIGFVMHMEGCDFKAACEKLGAKQWTPRPITQEAKPRPERITSKPPPDAGIPEMQLRGLGDPSKTWCYRNQQGEVLGYVARYETDKGKEIRCWTWGARGEETPGWGCGHWSHSRPLYGLERLGIDRARSVLVVEGEKTADAAQALLPHYAVVTWPGGAQAWKRADWAPIAGRKVLLWPDNDKPGIEAMAALAPLLADPRGYACRSMKIIDPSGQEPGFDAADWKGTTAELIAWAQPRARPYPPEPQPEPEPEQAPPPDDEAPQSSDMPLPTPMSEDAIADAFAEEHQKNWRYVAAWSQWMGWDGAGWRRDQKERVDRLAVEMCRRACTWEDAKSLSVGDKRRLGQRRTAGAVRDMARNDRRISASPDIWDADPLLVGIPGGVFDIRTGKVIEGDRGQFITRCTAVAPASGEPAQWLGHLERMMAGNEDMIRFLHAFAGYCATGDVSEQCFLFLYGMGQTGKGTFLLTIGEVLGSYAAYCSASTFMSTDREKHTSELARLAGCRYVVIDETDGTARWNEERIKRMTGGGKITAARKYHDEQDIPVTWKLAFAGNHKPALRGVGKEMERRIRLVKCNASIPDDAVDKRFRERMLAEEGPQILNWILEGAIRWRDYGLPLPDAIQDATRDYLQSEDTLGDWLEECCEQHGYTARPQAYKAFSAWMERRGDRPWSNRAWWAAMEDRGYKAKKTSGVWHVEGLAIKQPPESSSGYEIP